MAETSRPNPDVLLGYAQREAAREKRGRLKIFFGASAGVGKTYAMLEAARQLAIDGHTILVGYAEPHIRPDTERLLLGLDILPHLQVNYRGVVLREFDLDTALQSKAEIILIDELAHTNAPGLRHAKRWQDVMELLAAGFTVFTTLNVQHLESVNDVVASATGVRVQETLPDKVFEEADEVQLVDIPPEQLLQRLADGKIYRGAGADAALSNFFTIDNLLSLRELALRLTADRIDRERDLRSAGGTGQGGTSISERLLVCVGPSPSSADIVRAAARMAKMTHSTWTAVFVETPSLGSHDSSRRRLAEANLQLAEELGAKRVVLQGYNAAREIITFAAKENVARIIAGKPAASGWRRWLRSSFTSDLIRLSGSIAIDLIREPPGPKLPFTRPKPATSGIGVSVAIGVTTVAVTTLIGMGLYHGLHLSDINVIMLYLLGVMWLSARFDRVAGMTAAILSVPAFDFTVVPPYFSFAVSDTQYIITFVIMLIAGLLISTIATRLKQQEEVSRNRHRAMEGLLEMTQVIMGNTNLNELARAATHQIQIHFQMDAAFIMPGGNNKPGVMATTPGLQIEDKDIGVATWVLKNGLPAGAGTDTLPSARCLVMPLKGVRGVLGALAFYGQDVEKLMQTQTADSLRAMISQLVIAIERLTFSDESSRAWADAQRQALRNTLLTTVSHDLRTPLSAITGAATTLQEKTNHLTSQQTSELAASIADEARRMDRLIDKLLRMTRLETGVTDMRHDIITMEEVISSAVERLAVHHPHTTIHVQCPADLPVLSGDPELLEQVLLNLVENAIEHSSSTEPVEVQCDLQDNKVQLSVRDHGVGLDEEEIPHLFEKFYRSRRNIRSGGMGLGLAI